MAGRLPTTTNRSRAEEYAKLNTRKTHDGRLVARVIEVSAGLFAVVVDKNGHPFGSVSL